MRLKLRRISTSFLYGEKMKTIKEKPKYEKIKRKTPSATSIMPRRAAKLMRDKYLRQLDPAPESARDETGYATESVETGEKFVANEVSSHIKPRRVSRQNSRIKEEQTTQRTEDESVEMPAIKERSAVIIKDRDHMKQRTNQIAEKPDRQTRPGLTRQRVYQPRQSGQNTNIKAMPNPIKQRAQVRNIKRNVLPKQRNEVYSKLPAMSKTVQTPLNPITRPTAQSRQQRMTQQVINQTRKATKRAVRIFNRIFQAAAQAVTSLTGSLMGLIGGGILLVVLVVVIVIAAIASSPFGLFFAEERSGPNTASVAEAVAQVNVAYNTALEELQDGDYDSVEVTGQAADWPDVLAIFAARYAGAEDGVDVATLDADRIGKLTATFWDMTAITSTVETVGHPDSDPNDNIDDSWTESILHIAIRAKTANDMRMAYGFTDYQNDALNELLSERAALNALMGSLNITGADAVAILKALPDDLSPERRAVVETALTLHGKVNYFWGGKSYVLGWDSRWGKLQKVTSPGSSTTGTYRPYGLDCSGFVDWAFYNASGGDYIIGHGGGAQAQHRYCTNITWAEAQPGDLVFYPADEHIGIVCGRNDAGDLLVIHCASGYNNVVITGISGFTALGRPVYFEE